MERLCITTKECKQLIENELFGIFDENDDENLKALIERSKTYFDAEIIVFNYFISKLLEQYLKQDPSKCLKIIGYLRNVEEKMFLTLEEFDYMFIDSLMTQNMRNVNNTLEEDLLEVRNAYYG